MHKKNPGSNVVGGPGVWDPRGVFFGQLKKCSYEVAMSGVPHHTYPYRTSYLNLTRTLTPSHRAYHAPYPARFPQREGRRPAAPDNEILFELFEWKCEDEIGFLKFY